RGSGRGGYPPRDFGPPDSVLEMGSFLHAVEDEMLCSSLMPDKVPYFNAPIYLQNKSVIGKVDEILGPINEVYFSVKMGEGMVASSFKKGDKVYIGGDKLLPIERFLPKPKVAGGASIPMTGSHHANVFEQESLVRISRNSDIPNCGPFSLHRKRPRQRPGRSGRSRSRWARRTRCTSRSGRWPRRLWG
ncbi:Gar1/Naf1 RNA binding region-domain-containing protein, partial [Russula ochroleuca]